MAEDETAHPKGKKRTRDVRDGSLPYGAYGCHNCAMRMSERDALLSRNAQLEESVQGARDMLVNMFIKIKQHGGNPLTIDAVIQTTFRDMFGVDMGVYIPGVAACGTKTTS